MALEYWTLRAKRAFPDFIHKLRIAMKAGAPDWKSLAKEFWRKWRAAFGYPSDRPSIRIVPLARWLLAAEKLPTHQNGNDAASAAEVSF